MFQSTRPRGARPSAIISESCSSSFQSTRPRGARHLFAVNLNLTLGVSIHAPAWGATHCDPVRARPGRGFNPRARVGRDHHPGVIRLYSSMFQSTRPRGARLRSDTRATLYSVFQSTRPRGARREVKRKTLSALIVSIHAPAWGATQIGSFQGSRGILFQSTRPRGARHRTFTIQRKRLLFQSTRPRGARQHLHW